MIRCAKCKVETKEVVFPTYEYEEGIPLHNIKAFECPKCKNFIFTEKQVEEMEKLTDEIKARTFGFKRKITVSGRSLVISIPEDLKKFVNATKGKIATIFPLIKKDFWWSLVNFKFPTKSTNEYFQSLLVKRLRRLFSLD